MLTSQEMPCSFESGREETILALSLRSHWEWPIALTLNIMIGLGQNLVAQIWLSSVRLLNCLARLTRINVKTRQHCCKPGEVLFNLICWYDLIPSSAHGQSCCSHWHKMIAHCAYIIMYCWIQFRWWPRLCLPGTPGAQARWHCSIIYLGSVNEALVAYKQEASQPGVTRFLHRNSEVCPDVLSSLL